MNRDFSTISRTCVFFLLTLSLLSSLLSPLSSLLSPLPSLLSPLSSLLSPLSSLLSPLSSLLSPLSSPLLCSALLCSALLFSSLLLTLPTSAFPYCRKFDFKLPSMTGGPHFVQSLLYTWGCRLRFFNGQKHDDFTTSVS